MSQLSVANMRKEMKEFEEKSLPSKHWLEELSDNFDGTYNNWEDVPDGVIKEEYFQWRGNF